MRGLIKRFAAVNRMLAHEALQYRLEHLFFLFGIVEKPKRTAGIHQRVLANQVLYLCFVFVVERVIGSSHVGEFSVAALGVDHPR